MGYAATDLKVFKPLFDPGELEGTSYFELHPKELPRTNACWLPGSFFLRDAGFDFFAECFYCASPAFDYFSFQRFGQAEIVALLSELEAFVDDLRGEPVRAKVFSKYSSIFTPDIWSAVPTEPLKSSVIQTGTAMLTFVKQETARSECLWVLGM